MIMEPDLCMAIVEQVYTTFGRFKAGFWQIRYWALAMNSMVPFYPFLL